MLVASYRTTSGAVRHVHVLGPAAGGGWVVIDARGEDRRQIEALSAATDGRDQALAIATDYAEQAQVARRPLVHTLQPADGRERQAVAA
jgi:glycosyltransferase A (GT-A) superfamily protein (DUF2064 family)